MQSWHKDTHKIPCTWTYIHTYDQVKLTYIVHMHWVNFHSTQTIFSCLAEGRTNCWPEPETVTAQPLMWQRCVHTHTHTQSHNHSQWEDSPLRWLEGTNHYYLSVGGLMSTSLSVAALCRPVGVLIPKPDQFDPSIPSTTCFYIWNTVDLI